MSAKKQYFFCHKLRLIGFQVFAPGAKCRLDAFGQSVPGPVLVSTNIFFHCPAFGLSGIQMKDFWDNWLLFTPNFGWIYPEISKKLSRANRPLKCIFLKPILFILQCLKHQPIFKKVVCLQPASSTNGRRLHSNVASAPFIVVPRSPSKCLITRDKVWFGVTFSFQGCVFVILI